MQLVIAEKPSVARDLARALGVPARGKAAFEGGKHVITWCVGHLVELEEPAAYDARWKAWRLDTLPILPGELRLRAARHARAQLTAVAALLRERRFSAVVNACDAGREGELIFRYLLRYAKVSPPVLRLWVSSLTDEAIRRGFAALRPGRDFDALGDAARCRSEADWLVGLNATRAVTARAKEGGGATLYSIGRVQTPTLAMLAAREQEIERFVPTPYWEIRAELATSQGQTLRATWRHGGSARLASAALADAIVARAQPHGAASDAHGPRVVRVQSRVVKEPPPLLFDLTALQRTANRRYGFSAAHTLEVAQALYERHKLLTYPRTDSRHLSTDVARELPALLAALAAVPEYSAFVHAIAPAPLGRRFVDDAKVRDHHAILPTNNASAAAVAALGRDERRLFDLVTRRLLCACFPDAELAVTEAWIAVGAGALDAAALRATAPSAPRGAAEPEPRSAPLSSLPPPPDVFTCRGKTRLVAGWHEVAGFGDGAAKAREDGGERADEEEPALPRLEQGQRLSGRFSSHAKQTTPPPRYTEATLLGAMESAGKTIDDEALREAMRERGLGTPATRAAIIETLLDRGYVERDRGALVPTGRGRSLIDALTVPSLRSPELTGEWEARLSRVARGQETRAAFMADIARYVTSVVDAIRAAPPPAPGPDDGPAPARFGKARRGRFAKGAKGAKARSSKRGPRTKRPRAGAKARPAAPRAASRRAPPAPTASLEAASELPRPRAPAAPPAVLAVPVDLASAASAAQAAVERAIATGRAPRSAPSSEHRTQNAPAPRPPAEHAAAALDLGCPRCGQGHLVTGQRGWGCSRWREGCRFVVWFRTAGKEISPAQLRDLVRSGKTRKGVFFDDAGARSPGRLVLDVHADGGAASFVPEAG